MHMVEMKRYAETCYSYFSVKLHPCRKLMIFSVFFCGFLNIYKEHAPSSTTTKIHFTLSKKINGEIGMECPVAKVFMRVSICSFWNYKLFTVLTSFSYSPWNLFRNYLPFYSSHWSSFKGF